MNAIQVKAMCIVLRNGREVLASSEHDPATGESFGRLFGGGVEFGELAEDAVRREFREELGSTLENVLFLRVMENIFTYNSQPGHEVVFLFRGDLGNRDLYGLDSFAADSGKTTARWVPLADIVEGREIVYPAGIDWDDAAGNGLS